MPLSPSPAVETLPPDLDQALGAGCAISVQPGRDRAIIAHQPHRLPKTQMPSKPRKKPAPPGTPPAREDIIALRKAAGLSQVAAAEMIYSTRRTLQDWEAGITDMHPGLWELFQAKVAGILPGLPHDDDK